MYTQFEDSPLWDDYEREKLHFELAYSFMDHLRTMRRRTQNAVRKLFPRLVNGVPVQEIQQTVDDALYWLAIPDAWAKRYADEYVENWDVFEDIHITPGGIQWWIENEVDVLRLRGEWEPDDATP